MFQAITTPIAAQCVQSGATFFTNQIVTVPMTTMTMVPLENSHTSKVAEMDKQVVSRNKLDQVPTAYMIFCRSHKNEDFKGRNYVVEMSKRWKALDDLEKRRYRQLAQEEKAKKKIERAEHESSVVKPPMNAVACFVKASKLDFKTALQTWKNMNEQEKQPYVDEAGKLKHMYENASFKITQPLTPRAFFMKSYPSNNAKTAADVWKNMSEEAKKPFKRLALQDKLRYKNQCNGDAARIDDDDLELMMIKKPLSPFFHFMKSSKMYYKKALEIWKSMTSEQKEPFQKMSQEDSIRYKNECQAIKSKMRVKSN